MKRISIDLLRTVRVFFCLACYQVAPIFHELDLVLVGHFLLVEQLLVLVVEQLPFVVVEQLPNPILFSIRVSKRSLAEVEGDMYDFSYKTSPVFNLTTFGIQ